MEIFLDSADIEEIKEFCDLGLIDGVTTNPSLMAKAGRDFTKIVQEICDMSPGDVSVEVIATDFDNMIEQGEKIIGLAENIVLKLPVTMDGIRACRYFAEQELRTNMTLCFSVNQAIMAARAGATYISPFIGRLDDIGQSGMQLVKDIREVYDVQVFDTLVLASSIRSPEHVHRAAQYGAEVVTLSGKLIRQLFDHPLTTKGLEIFTKDWEKSGLKIK